MNHSTLIFVLLLAVCFGSNTVGARPINFSDDDFATWAQVFAHTDDPGGGSASGARSAAGGLSNGPFWNMHLQCETYTQTQPPCCWSVWAVYVKPTAVYSPRLQGPLCGVSRWQVASDIRSGLGAFIPLCVEQDGHVYYSATDYLFPSANWAAPHVNTTLIRANNFDRLWPAADPSSPLHPDFVNGSTLTFGIGSGASTGNDLQGFMTDVGIDAWQVELSQIPADADGNGVVNFSDITTVLSAWGSNYLPGTGVGDATRDGAVDFGDITSVLANWGASCS